MLQYLLNCSAIWLFSLLCYDIFLRRSTFHQYNRFYLLGSLFSGLLIPILSFESRQIYAEQVRNNIVVGNTVGVKKSILAATEAAGPVARNFDWASWIVILYVSGCLLSLAFMAKELVRIIILYRKGVKGQSGDTNIVITGKEHGPFSFFGKIFLSDKERYTETQLQMILAHEQRHNQMLHSMDVLLVQLCTIIFWFHPLPYFFRQRILMLHEYQADSVVERPLSEYGAFLLEQSLLVQAPALSNSFHRSPLKNRILMLTRKSTNWSKSKLLIALPVLALSLLCFSRNAFSDPRRIQKGNIVTYKGNVFELKVFPQQKMQYQNPETGAMEESTFEIIPYPVKMNNEPLPDTDSVDQKPTTEKSLNDYISAAFQRDKALFGQLEDGIYTISVVHFVSGKNGEVLYYKYDGVQNNKNIQLPGTNEWSQQKVNPVNVKEKIDQIIEKMAASIPFSPAIKNGKPVACFTEYGIGSPFYFTVKNHVASPGKIEPGVHKVVHHGDADTLEILEVEFK